ncbi:hypothetical protein ACFUTR_28935 [Streptomyces sp. NPDC057367]|uniref:hypothetical protein n=1 Tax=Streptomyces sp. NPDC057367 TaxID=3346108 RepID=UPI003624BBE1
MSGAARRLDWGRWKIDNLLHHVRDRIFREEDYVGRLPRIVADMRNLAIDVHRRDSRVNIAAALRRTA